jgi:hypothetical protein
MAVSRTVAPTLAGAAMSYGHLDGIMGLCIGMSLLAIAPLFVLSGGQPPLRTTAIVTDSTEDKKKEL